MAKKETAEQKLLKIIEATKKAQESSSGNVPSSVGKKRSRFMISMRQVNALLVIAVIASVIYLGYEFQNGVSMLGQEVTIPADQTTRQTSPETTVPRSKGLSHYLDLVTSRNIFQPYEKQTATAPVDIDRSEIESKLQNFRLVGIAWLDVPESATVMIEDKGTGHTRFLKEGDKLDDVTIKTIYTDRVVIGYENEEMVIKL